MKKARKMTALLAALFLLTVLLCACGGTKCGICGKEIRGQSYNTAAGLICESCYLSGASLGAASAKSNTGVWIAITVMVFVAVFSATSGVVYLVLQKVLPKEEPERHSAYSSVPKGYAPPQAASNRSTAPVSRPQQPVAVSRPQQPTAAPRPQQAAAYRPQPTASQQPVAARPQQPVQQNPRTYTGEWICGRDHSRNSGPFCVLCGAPRPRTTAPTAVGGNQQYTTQQQPAQRQQYAQQSARPAQQPVQRPAQAYTPSQQQYGDFRAASAARQAEPTARPAYQQPVSQEPELTTYTGRFAKRTAPAPEPVQTDSVDTEFDADLLEAILREAAEGDGK